MTDRMIEKLEALDQRLNVVMLLIAGVVTLGTAVAAFVGAWDWMLRLGIWACLCLLWRNA